VWGLRGRFGNPNVEHQPHRPEGRGVAVRGHPTPCRHGESKKRGNAQAQHGEAAKKAEEMAVEMAEVSSSVIGAE